MRATAFLALACLLVPLALPVAAAQVPSQVTAGPCKVEHGLFAIGLIARARCAEPGQELLFVTVSRLDVYPTCEVRVLGQTVATCERMPLVLP